MRELALRLPVPNAPNFDFSRTNVVSAADVFPPAKVKDTRTPLEKLMDARVQMIHREASAEELKRCEALMVRVANLEEEIEGFLDQQAREHLARLEAKRADLWAECRKIEDVIGAHIAEVGRVNSAANDRARVVADQRAKVHQATPPPFATNFPNQAETEAWNGRLAAARSGLAQAIEEQNEINLALSAVRALHAEAARELAAKVEELRAADSELIDFQKKK